MDCTFHKTEHDDYEWHSNSYGTFCRKALDEIEKPFQDEGKKTFNIGASPKDARIAHWREIQSRVTTHDGEFLRGQAARNYKQKYSKEKLGIDLSKPTDFSAPQYQKILDRPLPKK